MEGQIFARRERLNLVMSVSQPVTDAPTKNYGWVIPSLVVLTLVVALPGLGREKYGILPVELRPAVEHMHVSQMITMSPNAAIPGIRPVINVVVYRWW